METSGYSGTALSKKLGYKEGFRVRLINEPANYQKLVSDLPPNVFFLNNRKSKKDLLHYFTKQVSELEGDMPLLKAEIEENGSIWISWPKKTSKVETNISEDIVREIAISNGLVDIKVCAVDEIWSGLKLVIPLKDRKAILP